MHRRRRPRADVLWPTTSPPMGAVGKLRYAHGQQNECGKTAFCMIPCCPWAKRSLPTAPESFAVPIPVALRSQDKYAYPVHELILHLPVATTVFSLLFSWALGRRYRDKGKGAHLLWWAAGILIYGVGTFTEAFVTLFGWNPWIFRAWYISGALLGGAPLAQGTVYLLLSRKTANRLTSVLVPFILVAAALVLMTPLDLARAEPHRLSGSVIGWQWVRLFSPFINTYALIFLVGGAALSAYRFRKRQQTHHRFVGNVCIAVGALLPGIGGAFTRFGYVEVLYVTELIGLTLIYIGYRWNIRAAPAEAALPAVARA